MSELHSARPVVVKLGGSLYDLPDLGARLRAWLPTLRAPTVLIVPGGGAAANAIRSADAVHGLGAERAHWLALRALTLNAHWLQHLLPDAHIASDVGALGGLCLLDAFAFALADEARPDRLPHDWIVTSDSIALRAALVAGASSLWLLKSAPPPCGDDWQEAMLRGYVDPLFPVLLWNNDGVHVRALNFRSWRPGQGSE